MFSNFIFVILFAIICTCTYASAQPSIASIDCDSSSALWQSRHRMQLNALQSNREQGGLWKQSVSVVVKVSVGETQQWIQPATFDFWQDNLLDAENCRFNETQAWPRIDQDTGEFHLAFQRIFIHPTPSYYKSDFTTSPPRLIESEAEYAVEWYQGLYLEESAIVIDTSPVEYSLGDKIVSAGWYRADGSLPYVNTLIDYVPGVSRTYTINTILEAVPGDASTQYKIMADIESSAEIPPAIISQAFEWYNQVVDDPSVVPTTNPITGIPEYLFYPSQHATRGVQIDETMNTSPSLNYYSHKAVQEMIQNFLQLKE